jgi:predicted transposase YdaD
MLGLITEEPRAIREAKEEGEQQGIVKGERSLVLRQLSRRLGNIPDALLSQIQALSLERLEALGDALLDFSTLADLEGWLQGEVRG